MGKGDKKSRRGKIIMGSYGVRRPRKTQTNVQIPAPPAIKAEEPVAKPKTKAAPAAKSSEPKPKAVRKSKAVKTDEKTESES